MGKPLRRGTPRYLFATIVSMAFMVILCILVSFLIVRRISNKYKLELNTVKEQFKLQEAYVYEAKQDIPAGSLILEENLNYIQIHSTQNKNHFMKEENIGMVSKIDIRKGTYLLEDMLADDLEAGFLREIEYNVFFTNSNLNNNDFVDVRILFPNGEDFIVLSKKSIKDLNKETGNCFLWLDEKETLDMAGAVVDSYLYPGTKLYTTKYLEPSLQEPSITTYKPNLSTLALIEKDENVLRLWKELDGILEKAKDQKENQSFHKNQKIRKDLEFRLQEFYESTNILFEEPIQGVGGNGDKFYSYEMDQHEENHREEMTEYGG